MYYIFVENNQINGAGQVPIMNSEISNIEISEKIYESYIQDPLKYVVQENQIILNPDYESLIRQQEIEKRKSEIKEELNKLDLKRIRAVCENETKEGSNETWLEYYNKQIKDLRKELEEIDN